MNPDNAKELLRVLIMLAYEDGEFHPREERFIRDIARANQLPEGTIEQLMATKTPVEELSSLPYEDKFEILYNLLIMMKADNIVMDKEVMFIQKIAFNLGFQLSAIMELYPYTHANVRDPQKIRALRKALRAHRLNADDKEGATEG